MNVRKLCLLVMLFAMSSVVAVEAVGLPVGTLIGNYADIYYSSEGGASYSSVSNTALTSTLQTYGSTLTPDNISAYVKAGREEVVGLSLANTGNGPDGFVLTASTDKLWPVAVYSDVNGDGILQTAERVPIDKIENVVADEICKLFVVVLTPSNIANGDSDTLRVNAQSLGDTSKIASASVALQARRAHIALDKRVDANEALSGSVLTYTITYTNIGSLDATGSVLVDAIPLNSIYVPDSLKLNGIALPITPNAEGKLVVQIGTVPVDGVGVVTFQVKIK